VNPRIQSILATTRALILEDGSESRLEVESAGTVATLGVRRPPSNL
jgi:hypothetical protein